MGGHFRNHELGPDHAVTYACSAPLEYYSPRASYRGSHALSLRFPFERYMAL